MQCEVVLDVSGSVNCNLLIDSVASVVLRRVLFYFDSGRSIDQANELGNRENLFGRMLHLLVLDLWIVVGRHGFLLTGYHRVALSLDVLYCLRNTSRWHIADEEADPSNSKE